MNETRAITSDMRWEAEIVRRGKLNLWRRSTWLDIDQLDVESHVAVWEAEGRWAVGSVRCSWGTWVATFVRRAILDEIERQIGYCRGGRLSSMAVATKGARSIEELLSSDHPYREDPGFLEVEALLFAEELLKPLSKPQREVIRLRFLEGLDTAETATLLGLTEDTVTTYVTSGRRKLERFWGVEQVKRDQEMIQDAFLNALGSCKNVSQAIRESGSSRYTVYTRRASDTAFARAWDAALEQAQGDAGTRELGV